MSSCFSRCLRVPIAIRAFYESYLWILQTLLLRHQDLHPGLLEALSTTIKFKNDQAMLAYPRTRGGSCGQIHPRPMNGILVAIRAINCTLATKGRLAM